jgi:hypothetical protein
MRVLFIAALLSVPAFSDEGMWTLDNLPTASLQQRYGFAPSKDWIDRVKLAALRFNDGGSGSFVSADGLVLTNHHVALGQLGKVSSEKKDYVKEGFFARSAAGELKCPDLEVNQLVSLEDVTARVLAAVPKEGADKDKNEKRKAEISRIEKESSDKTGLRSDVVELYQGGEYWLYRYKKYKDVRLVFAPEQQAAFYGGDPDNFTYPRFDFDMALFRIYEDGKAVKPASWLRFSKTGPKDGELTFVAGHPGRTSRLMTVAELEFERDRMLPTRLEIYGRQRASLSDYSKRGPEQERRAKDRLFGIENALKAWRGELEGFQEKGWQDKKAKEEKELASAGAADAIAKIAGAQKELASRYPQYMFRKIGGGKLPFISETIVRYVAETPKPNEKRYEEFRDSNLDSLRFRLFSPAPIYKDMEEVQLATTLQMSLDKLGADDPYVKAALKGRTPAERAHEAISGTKLDSVDFRKTLVEGGTKAVEASDDPLIVLSRTMDPLYREQRDWFEANIESILSLEGNQVAKTRFQKFGKSAYPDATFTLRLSYGKAAGYELGTTKVPYKTTFYGLYDRSASFNDKYPFNLPPLVDAARSTLALGTGLNFVTTNDIIGGNSGSPVFNKELELVGLIFDGNIQSLIWDYVYTDVRGRAVAVHSAGILEGLSKIYKMDGLVKELTAP